MKHFLKKLVVWMFILMTYIGTCSAQLSGTISQFTPSLNLSFTNTETLDSRLTFTRNSIGTRTNSTGLIETVAANQPRFDYDPVTLQARGILIEESRTNLFLRSENFANGTWTKGGGVAVVTDNVEVSPTGTTNAALFTTNTSKLHCFVRQSLTLTNGATYTVSAFVKRYNYDYVGLRVASTGTHAMFNLTTLTWGGSNLSSYQSYGYQSVGNGWYRIWATRTITEATGTNVTGVCLVGTSGEEAPTNLSGGEGLYLFGAQLESGAFVTSYIPTAASSVTRSGDLCLLNNLNWFNPSQGTWIAETVLGQRVTARIIGYDGANNFLGIRSTGQQDTESYNGTASFTKQGVTSTGTVRHGMSYSSSNRVLTREGLTPNTSATSIGSVTQISLGSNPNGTNNLCAWIRKVVYYPRQVSNSLLQSLTQ
ncbi:phage head spike fiber domain-containing protein [Spirosoma terrae]|uniref:CBM-cenC domain-containing protein n=1 Tax=Spirosoma terrae TaxID=1968276 RepID=A0A6L9L581_9BACT|nr:hypothetical protein [Spirosoma terrae]NDU95706.1 hypothetical protein [Spirosoma terrae]